MTNRKTPSQLDREIEQIMTTSPEIDREVDRIMTAPRSETNATTKKRSVKVVKAKAKPKRKVAKAKAKPKKKKVAKPKPKKRTAKPKPRTKLNKKPATRTKAKKTSTKKTSASRAKRPRAARHEAIPAAPMSSDRVIRLVNQAVIDMPKSGRFGPQKVFVSAIYDVVGKAAGVSLPEFKRMLVDANRERKLDLARADLIGSMPASKVERSEISDMGATFHFVVDHPKGW